MNKEEQKNTPQTPQELAQQESGRCPEADAERLADDMCAAEAALNMDSSDSRLEEALEEAAKNKDLYLRTVADLDTYRRKVQREKEELAKFAMSPLIEELLPSLDHLGMAVASAKSNNEAPALTTGVEMVLTQIKKVFSDIGVAEISAEGNEFDPKLEECVAHEASDTVAENCVIRVMRSGYTYNGRLLRPASVVVSSGKKA